jgi:hypothetical protein
VDETNGAHVVEASQAELLKHLGRHPRQLPLVQFQSDLVNFLEDFIVFVGDGTSGILLR